jgi:WD40 repeat protein
MGDVLSLAASADGKTLAVGCSDKTVRLLDGATYKETVKLEGHADGVLAVAFSPDGKLLASAGGAQDRTVRVWDVSTGKEVAAFKGHDGAVVGVALVGAKSVVSAGDDGNVLIWDLPEKK